MGAINVSITNQNVRDILKYSFLANLLSIFLRYKFTTFSLQVYSKLLYLRFFWLYNFCAFKKKLALAERCLFHGRDRYNLNTMND